MAINSVRDTARQIFASVPPEQAPDLLERVIEQIRLGAQDVGVAAYGDIPLQPISSISQLTENVLIQLATKHIGEEEAEPLFDNPMPYWQVVSKLPELEGTIREYVNTHDFITSDHAFDNISDNEADAAARIEELLTDNQRDILFTLVTDYLDEQSQS